MVYPIFWASGVGLGTGVAVGDGTGVAVGLGVGSGGAVSLGTVEQAWVKRTIDSRTRCLFIFMPPRYYSVATHCNTRN